VGRIKSVDALCQELDLVLACSFMHVFSDVLHSRTSPSILSTHFSWKAQYDISWFPLLAGADSRNFMTKTSAINTVLTA